MPTIVTDDAGSRSDCGGIEYDLDGYSLSDGEKAKELTARPQVALEDTFLADFNNEPAEARPLITMETVPEPSSIVMVFLAAWSMLAPRRP